MAFIKNEIDQYRARLGLGARQNLYSVRLVFPAALGFDADLSREFDILCRQATLPRTRPLDTIPVEYQGEDFKIPGNRQPVDPITFAFQNSEDMRLRQAFDAWLQLIITDRQNPVPQSVGLRSGFAIHNATVITIAQLNSQRREERKVQLINAWPSELSEGIEFGADNKEISLTNVQVQFDFFRYVPVK